MKLRELLEDPEFSEAPPDTQIFLCMPGELRFPISRVSFSGTHHAILEVYRSDRRMTKQFLVDSVDRMFNVEGGFRVIATAGAVTFFINKIRYCEGAVLLDWTCMLNRRLVVMNSAQVISK